MVKKYLFAFFLVCFSLQLNNASSLVSENMHSAVMPNATISVDITTVCQYNDSPVITFTGSAGTAPYTFTYTRNGVEATISTAGNDNSVTLDANTNFSGTITYVLTAVQDQTGTSTMVTGQTISINITEGPDPTINGDGTEPGQFLFSICNGDPTATFTFTNASTTASTLNTNYTIDWGDGSTPFTGTTWDLLTHDYNQGTYTLTYTIVGNNGCTTEQEYTVFLGSTPGIGFDTPGNTTICAGGSLTFQITGFENNPPSTTYTIVFSDGTTLPTITHPPPSSITHQFNVTSCGTNSGGFMNSFSATISASNLCATSTATVAPILISSDPVADFSFPTEPSCTNTEVCFEDLSMGNATNGSNNDCDTNPSITWQITPNTYTISSGTLGNDFGSTNPNLWVSGSENLCVNFTQPGNYTITQMVGNTCAIDTVSQTICVEAPVNPQFNLSATTGCTPLDVTTTNTTDESTSCIPPTYQWQVSYAADFCGTTPENWSFTNGTSATSASPSFNFVTPGTYTIELAGTNSCGETTNSQQVIVKQPPTAVINPIGIICNTTSITPSATIETCTDDASSVTYDWQFPGATPATSNMQSPGTIDYGTPGTYTFTLQVTNDCGVSSVISETFTIEDVPVIINTDLTQEICSGTSTTAINLMSSVAGTTFNWTATATGGISGFTAVGNSATIPAQVITTSATTTGTVTYTVTPSIGSCNGTPVDFTITVNPAPEINTQPQSSTVCQNGMPNTLSVATSGTSPQYQWYSNTTNSTIGGTPIAGETNANYIPPTDTVGEVFYYCEIMFATGGCSTINSQVASITVTPNATITSQPTPIQSLCVGSTITTPLTVSFTNGTGTVSYQWFSNTTNSNTGGTAIAGETNATFTPPTFTATGNFYYYVELSFAGSGCTNVVSDVAEIEVVATPVINMQPIATQTLCQNSIPQNLEVQASGGLGTFSYQWFSNTVNNNTGGTAIAGATNAIFTPPTTTVGTLYYYCVVSQAASDSCAAVSTTSEVNINPAPLINSQPQSQEICLGNTVNTLMVSFTNGVGTPTYQWYSNTVDDTTSGTAITGQTTNSYTPNVSTIGTNYYYCIITFSSGGCTEITSNTAEIIVNETPTISNFTETICSGNSFTIAPDTSSGDIVPLNTMYTWTAPSVSPAGSITGAIAETTPQTNISQALTNTTTLPAMVTYTVTPTAGICDGTPFTIVVTVNPAISANVTITNIDCFGDDDGEITTNITGGVPFNTGAPYIISWTGPAGFTSNTASISNLVPGDYTLMVQDEGGCPFSETYTITAPTELILTVDTETSISCFGQNDGEITVSVSGGTPNYTYNWTRNGAPFSTNEDISNLTAATYELTVSDANNCGPIVQSFTITEPNELSVSLVSQMNLECFGDASGTIEINTIGGTPTETSPGVFEYTYAWTGPNGFTSTAQNLTGLAGGTYNITVTDANGCDDTLSVILTQPDEIVITTTNTDILCFGDNDASITITNITGGSGTYTIEWSNFGEGMSQTNLSAGDYTITVTDSNNCTASVTVTIPAPPIFTINPVVTQISCFGANDGSIMLNFQGGQDPIDFAWADDPNAGVERNNLGPGTYTINIVDAVPCTITETFIILEPAALSLSSNITNALDCDDPNSGAINLLITGGTAPFTINWSNGATTEDLDNIPPGDYVVTVTDDNGCDIIDTYTVVRPSPIEIAVETETIANCNSFTVNQTFTAQVSGGVPPYDLNWSSGIVTGANDEMMTTMQNGLVILEATDALGCVSNYTFEVDIPELSNPDFNLSSIAFDTFGIYSQLDPIQFTNTTTGDFTNVSWNFGDGNFSNEENPLHTYASPGSYTVIQTVTFPGDCVYERVITLLIEKGYKLIMPTAFTPNDDGLNDFFRPVFIGLDNMQLDIYDTWGSLIYSETGDDVQGWDGKVKGELVENGNYYYTFTAKTFFGSVVRENGPLTLIL